MRRTSRAFAPRPLYVGTSSKTENPPPPVELPQKETDQVKSTNNLKTAKRNRTLQKEALKPFVSRRASIPEDEVLVVETYDDFKPTELPEPVTNHKPTSTMTNSKNPAGRRRSSGFGTIPLQLNSETMTSTSEMRSSEMRVQPKPSARPRDRFKSKPLYPSTPVNPSIDSISSFQNGGLRQRSSRARIPITSLIDMFVAEQPGGFTEEEMLVATDTGSDEIVLTPEDIIASPEYYPEMIQEVKKVTLVRKIKKMIFEYKDAQEEQARLQILEKKKEKRAEILQRMLKLDKVEMRLFVMEAYDYDRYMAAATASKSIQASTQTNEGMKEVEVQTEVVIEGRVRWTQMPPRWSDSNNALSLEQSTKCKNIGAGEDTRFLNGTNAFGNQPTDLRNLNDIDFVKEQEKFTSFVRGASHLIMAIMESKRQLKMPLNSVVKLDRKLVVLRDMEIGMVCCNQDFVACTSGSFDIHKWTGGKHVITVWSIQEPSIPMYFLRVWGQVLVLEMSKMCSLVMTGNKDSSLNIWDLKESPQYHSKNREDQVIRTPSITTGGIIDTLRHHTTEIIGLQILPETQRRSRIFTLDRNKTLVFWSCSHEEGSEINSDMGYLISQWSTLRIQIRQMINLTTSFPPDAIRFRFLKMWEHNAFHFLIGTDYGYLARGIMADTETKVTYDKINMSSEEAQIKMFIYSIDLNVERNLILSCCQDGNCRLIDISIKKTITTVHCGQNPIKVRWSKRRRSAFYVLVEDRIDIWDLLISDLIPAKSMDFKSPKDFDLLNTRNNEFIVVIAEDGMTVQTPPFEVNALTAREEGRFKMYLSIIQ